MSASEGAGAPDPCPEIPEEAARWVAALGLEPLPHEGGLFRQAHLNAHSTAIYFLLAGDDFSALHSLESVEIYHWYAGSPLRLLLLHPDGRAEEQLVGADPEAGLLPQFAVPAGVMQGSSSTGDWTLVGTTMAPGFDWEGFRLGDREELAKRYPEFSKRIAELTR